MNRSSLTLPAIFRSFPSLFRLLRGLGLGFVVPQRSIAYSLHCSSFVGVALQDSAYKVGLTKKGTTMERAGNPTRCWDSVWAETT